MVVKLLTQLKRHEGFRSKPYHCTGGKLTIGYGRNLDDVGIDNDEAEYLLRSDIAAAERVLEDNLPWFGGLDVIRRCVLVNMCFNLGWSRFSGFKRMLAACEAQDWETAKKELLDSRYADQVGQRAQELADQLLTGEWQT